jgi:hypothetical protein
MSNNSKQEEPLKDFVYDEFVAILSVSNIKEFNEKCKEKHLDIKNTKRASHSTEGCRLDRGTFVKIMLLVFGKDYMKDKKEGKTLAVLEKLCEKMFNRFKIMNCEIKTEKQKNLSSHENAHDYYYVGEILNDQHEIETYEFACALAMFPKIDFKEKMKLLFEITDADSDGYINEEEIRNMIFIVNFLFSDEEASLMSNSTIINQSLANIKSGQIFNMIMKHPGYLYRVVSVEKYVEFEQFYNSISKIDNFKYSIIPSFINFKTALNTKKNEPEYEIDKKNINEFLSITNEVVSSVKSGNCELIKYNKDIKKLLDAKAESKAELLTKKQRNFVHENKKSVRNKTNSNKITLEYPDSDAQVSYEHTNNNNLPPIFNRGKKEKTTIKNNKKFKDLHHYLVTESYNLNYNKITNLETQPGKIRVKEYIPANFPKSDSAREKTENSQKEKINNKSGQKHLTIKEDKKNIYISYAKIMNEVRSLSFNKNNANNEDFEEVRKLLKSAYQIGNELTTKFDDKTSKYSLKLSLFNGKAVV